MRHNIQSINGPINIIRLAKKGKILYLFFDVHENIADQTECNTNNNIDIVNFLHESFLKLKDNIDFFLEASPLIFTDNETIDNIRKENYIDSIQKWVARNFNYDKNRDKVLQSNKYTHVRFHYFDFRQYFEYLEFKDVDIISFIGTFTKNMKELSSMLLESSHSQHKHPILLSETKNIEIRQRFIYKIMNRYNNNQIKKKITKYIHSVYSPFIKNSLNYVYDNFPKVNEAIEIYEHPRNKLNKRGYGLNYEVVKKSSCFIDIFAHKVINLWLDTFVYLVDIYFIRRFLDKNYIKRSVIYAGAFHCIHIILVLVKYFDFEITHAFYSSVKLRKINEIIKNLKHDDPYQLIEYLWTPYLFQCSDMKDFPENFE